MESRSSADGPANVSAESDVPLDLLLGALGEGVYGVDLDGRATFLNPAGCRLLGYSAEEFLGRRQHDLIHRSPTGTGPSSEECLIYAVLQDGLTRHVNDELFYRKDGHGIPVEYTATALREEDRVVGAVVVFRDIEERVRTEAELLRLYERQRTLLENLPDAAWMKDEHLRYIAVNEKFVCGTGVRREQLLGDTAHSYLAEEHAARYEELDRQVLETGEPSVVEEQLRWGNPKLAGRWIETIRAPVPGPDGRPAGIVGLARDTTTRKRLADADTFLAEAGQVIISSLAWTETVDGIAMLVVPRMGDWCVLSIFGDPTEPPAVSGFAARPDDQRRLRSLLARDPRAYGPENYLIGRVLLDGQGERILQPTRLDLEALAGGPDNLEQVRTLRPASLLVIPLSAHSTTVGVLVLTRGPERPPFEEPDLLLVEEVGRRAALVIEHARQHRAAREAVAARDEVLRVVAHDLRGLASTVSLSARLLASEPGGRQVRALRRIEQATQEMDRLIQDLTDADRVARGHPPTLALTALEPESLLRDAAEAADPLAQEQGIRMVAEPAVGLPLVRGDRDPILRVFANLIRNAIQFSAAGSTVRLKAEPLGREIVFSVEDSGPGIAEEDLPHVFDRFWRVRGAPRGGTGLGLPIARGIVSSHGGRIWCTSELGSGTRFWFTLPCHDHEPGGADGGRSESGDAGSHTQRSDSAPGDNAPDDPHPHDVEGPVRVLVVDDHPIIRDGVRGILAEASWIEVVGEASHGEEAVWMARSLEPDVIVMDLALPGIDGYETMRRIDSFSRRTRVLVLTAHAPEKTLVKSMEAGAYGFVRKTSAHKDLLPAVRTVLRGEMFLDAHSNAVLVRSLERALEVRRRLAGLTRQERDIVRLTAAGHTAQEVAKQLYLSPHTVASYRSRAIRKLGLEHRSDLVHFALETDLIGVD
jgi:PAS domain S-box-containing protein